MFVREVKNQTIAKQYIIYLHNTHNIISILPKAEAYQFYCIFYVKTQLGDLLIDLKKAFFCLTGLTGGHVSHGSKCIG